MMGTTESFDEIVAGFTVTCNSLDECDSAAYWLWKHLPNCEPYLFCHKHKNQVDAAWLTMPVSACRSCYAPVGPPIPWRKL